MDKIKEIIGNWGFQEGVKGYWYKFITTDSSVTFEFRENTVTITFKMLCGTGDEELIPIETGTIISKDMIEHSPVIGAYLKDTIMKTITNAHKKALWPYQKIVV